MKPKLYVCSHMTLVSQDANAGEHCQNPISLEKDLSSLMVPIVTRGLKIFFRNCNTRYICVIIRKLKFDELCSTMNQVRIISRQMH